MIEQLRLQFKADGSRAAPSSKLTHAEDEYMDYEPACSDEDCLEVFRYVFGYTPRELVRTGGAVLVGPISGNGVRT